MADWTHYTTLIEADEIMPVEWAEELHDAIMERRSLAGLSTFSFLGFPDNRYWTWLNDLVGNLGAFVKPDTLASETNLLSAVATVLGHTPDFGGANTRLPTADWWNACRIACDLLYMRRLSASAVKYTRRGQAAGVGEDYYPEGGFDENYGSTSYAAAVSTANTRYTADSTSPENNETNDGSSTSGSPYGAHHSVAAYEYDGGGNDYLYFASARTLRWSFDYDYPSELLGLSLDWYLYAKKDPDSDDITAAVVFGEHDPVDYYSILQSILGGTVQQETFNATAVAVVDGTPKDMTALLTTSDALQVIRSAYTKASGDSFTLDWELSGAIPTPPDSANEYRYNYAVLHSEDLCCDLRPHLEKTSAVTI